MTQHTDFLYYLYTNKYGRLSELTEHFGNDGVHQMEAMGYIVNVPSRDGDTWHCSNNAARLAELRYRKSSLIERIIDWINLNIRKIDYSITKIR